MKVKEFNSLILSNKREILSKMKVKEFNPLALQVGVDVSKYYEKM